jgi:leucine-rich repeat-containing G protein-coupled receptor 7/leucine-rich repeat-containing G protein-coupled receptor 8
MLTFFGIDIEKDVYAWMVVVVLPINSALNPILYTLTSVLRNKVRRSP